MFKNVLKSHIFGYGMRQRMSVFGITLLVLAVSFGAGRLLDYYFQQKAAFTIGIVIISFPVTQYVLYKFFSNKS